MWSGRPRAALGPSARALVFLTDAGPHPEPVEGHRRTRSLCRRPRRLSPWRWPPHGRGSFFKLLDGAFGLRVMARTRRKFAIIHRTQHAAHRLFGNRDAELVIGPLAKIDYAPTHNAMGRRDRAALNDLRQCFALRRVQKRAHPWRFLVDQPVRAEGVELDHPIADDL